MQRCVGNAAVRGLVQRMCADCAKGGAKCEHCHDEEEAHVARLQRSTGVASGGSAAATAAAPSSAPASSAGASTSQVAGASAVPSSVRTVLSQVGSPLPSEVRATMESGFGRSFAGVRVHTGAAAAHSAAEVGALAYTVGGHIVFGAGHFAPGTDRGSHLLAHELTHVVQQRYARIDFDRLALDDGPSSAPEREAETMAARVVAGDRAQLSPLGAPNLLQRRMVEDEASGGCGLCLGPQAAGDQAHAELQMQFLVDLRKGGFERVVEHYVRGAPGDDNGFLDLAAFDGKGNIFIGEIKPANSQGLMQGHSDIKWYTDQIKKEGTYKVRPLTVAIDTRVLVFPNPNVECEGLPQLIEHNPATLDGVYTYYCTPTRKELWEDPECRCWPKRKKKRKEKRKEKEKDKDKPVDKHPPPIVFDGPRDGNQDRPGDTKSPTKEKPVEEEPAEEAPAEEAPAEEAPEGEQGTEEKPGDGKSDGEEGGKSDGESDGESEGGGKNEGGGEDYGIFPGRLPPGYGIPHPSPEASAAAARLALAAVIAAAVIKFGGKRVLGPVTAAATLLLLANGAQAEISLKGDDPLTALIESGGKKGIKIPPELEEAIRKDPKIMDTLRRAAASGDLTKAQQEMSTRLTETIVANRDKLTDAELEELVKITDPKNGAMPVGNASVEEIKKLIAAHKAGAQLKGGGGTGTGAPSGPKPAQPTPKGGPPPTVTSAPPGPGGGTVPATPGSSQGEKSEVPADPHATGGKDGAKGAGGGGAESSGDPSGAKGPAVALPPATTPATKLLNAWAQGGGPGPKITEEAKKRFLDWASSIKPPLTDAEAEKLAPLFIGNTDKTIDQALKSVQDGLTALRTEKDTPPDAVPGDADAKTPPNAGAKKPKNLPAPKKPMVGKDAKKTAPASGGDPLQKQKPMSPNEKELGKHIAKFLSTVTIAEEHAHWILDDGANLVADPSGKALVGAWMYYRLNGGLFMAHVSLHPTAKEGNVWTFHLDEGASIYDRRGVIVSTSNAYDTKGILSNE